MLWVLGMFQTFLNLPKWMSRNFQNSARLWNQWGNYVPTISRDSRTAYCSSMMTVMTRKLIVWRSILHSWVLLCTKETRVLSVKEVEIHHNHCRQWTSCRNRQRVLFMATAYTNDYTSCTDPERYQHSLWLVPVSLQNLPPVIPAGLASLYFLNEGR